MKEATASVGEKSSTETEWEEITKKIANMEFSAMPRLVMYTSVTEQSYYKKFISLCAGSWLATLYMLYRTISNMRQHKNKDDEQHRKEDQPQRKKWN